jgi:hypothetical protein
VGTSGMPESSAGVSPAASAVVACDSRACTGAGSVERPARGRSRPKNGGEPNGVEPQWVGVVGKGWVGGNWCGGGGTDTVSVLHAEMWIRPVKPLWASFRS